jgi:hypothetical protein
MTRKSEYTESPKKNDALVIDLMKKLLTLSIGGILFTEETIRKSISELKLSKDIATFVMQQSTKSKEDLLRFISEEIVKAMKDVKIEKEIKKILENYKININMEIHFEAPEKKSFKTRAKFDRKRKSTSRSKTLKSETND